MYAYNENELNSILMLNMASIVHYPIKFVLEK